MFPSADLPTIGAITSVWYSISFLLCIAIGRALWQRRSWARKVGMFYAIFHIASLFVIHRIGPIGVVNVLLGFFALASIMIANTFGAFDEDASRTAEPS